MTWCDGLFLCVCAVSSVEDPEKVLDQAVEDMQNDLIRLRQAAAEVTASEKRMQAKRDQAQNTAVRSLMTIMVSIECLTQLFLCSCRMNGIAGLNLLSARMTRSLHVKRSPGARLSRRMLTC